MRNKFSVGSKYIIQFYDHCLGDFQVLCEVMIRVTKEDSTHVYGTWWLVITDNKDVEEANREMISVIKSTIVKKRKIHS